MQININWLYDESDCETCGSAYAGGAEVTFPDADPAIEPLVLEPIATCFDGADYARDEVFKRILTHLGHVVVETEE